MFIFDDLVIVASQHEKGGLFAAKKKGDKVLRVLPESEGGIGKVLEVKDWSGWQGHGTLFALTIMPISHTLRNPQNPMTNAYTLPTPSSPRKSSLTVNCPTLISLPQFMATLAQATTAGNGMSMSEYKEEEVLAGLDVIGENSEGWRGHDMDIGALGFAQ